MAKKALALIDVQVGFIDGNLGIGLDKFLPVWENIAKEVGGDYDYYVVSKDWHPSNHCSFKEYGGPWPSHCVQDTKDADLYPKLQELLGKVDPKKIIVIKKGMDAKTEEYGVDVVREMKDIKYVKVVGLCTDYCVSESARMTKKAHPEVEVVCQLNACGEIAVDTAKAGIEAMKATGVKIL